VRGNLTSDGATRLHVLPIANRAGPDSAGVHRQKAGAPLCIYEFAQQWANSNAKSNDRQLNYKGTKLYSHGYYSLQIKTKQKQRNSKSTKHIK
jgi:hypothetical protein